MLVQILIASFPNEFFFYISLIVISIFEKSKSMIWILQRQL